MFSINVPMTFSWISTEREKQIVYEPSCAFNARLTGLISVSELKNN
ncbi:hypothetical protein Asd1617_03769 [Shigella dysenteriae 1617]|uniref:Uncharacterized protein n=1 Tax=Shigella dysenteriae 1617 TaxID=754093 RepID=A0A0A6ZY55_SHIDY|nr:hypothetical protein Asd1617_03769 [Shigella dysenteriae 1617]